MSGRPPKESISACPGCGLFISGGKAGCQALFKALLAQGFRDPGYLKLHRIMVDLYALQHPERYCISGKSTAVHLMRMRCFLEKRQIEGPGRGPIRKWLERSPRLERPPIPANRGRLTIADIRSEPDLQAYAAALERWARSVWKAYSPLHGQTRKWIAQVGNCRK